MKKKAKFIPFVHILTISLVYIIKLMKIIWNSFVLTRDFWCGKVMILDQLMRRGRALANRCFL